ncbi:MAG: hypothetical protein IKI37_09090 [Oscillospiraceae bacterium]|nr:hypothetical protein [Oscillospiraceae bacterium]
MKKTGNVTFPCLESEITRRGIRKMDIQQKLGINHSSFSYKLNGERPFTLEQGLTIWKTWFSDIPIDELFKKED